MIVVQAFIQARNQGGFAPLERFSPSLEKCVGRSLKILDIVQKILAPLGKLFALHGSQAGYGPAFIRMDFSRNSFTTWQWLYWMKLFSAISAELKML